MCLESFKRDSSHTIQTESKAGREVEVTVGGARAQGKQTGFGRRWWLCARASVKERREALTTFFPTPSPMRRKLVIETQHWADSFLDSALRLPSYLTMGKLLKYSERGFGVANVCEN